jgi:hypothetical protein
MTKSNLTITIDTLGEIKAQIADLLKVEKDIKASLEGLAPGTYAGETFQLSISVADRETLDMEAVREHLSRQFIAAHTNVTSVRTVRVAARSTSKVAA